MEGKSKSRLNRKGQAVEFKDDDYETPKNVLEDLIPFVDSSLTIYDPFYCNGKVIDEWKELGYTCINEKKDAFNREHPEYDIMISNIPFSLKKECMDLGMDTDKPFIFLMPIDVLGSLWIGKYWEDISIIVPKKRYSFIKKGQKTNSSWFDTCWICKGIDIGDKIIKLY